MTLTTTTSQTSSSTTQPLWASATPSVTATACPQINVSLLAPLFLPHLTHELQNTLYVTSSNTGNQKTLWRRCGIDYSSKLSEATDLGTQTFDSMPQCMDYCASLPTCEGVAWGPDPGTKIYHCILKTRLVSWHVAVDNPNWAFAQVVPVDT